MVGWGRNLIFLLWHESKSKHFICLNYQRMVSFCRLPRLGARKPDVWVKGVSLTHSNATSLKKLLCGTLVSLPHKSYKNTYIFFPHCIHFQLKNFNRLRFVTSHLRKLQTTGNENLTKCRWHSQPILKACWAPLSPGWPLAKRECSDETPSLSLNGFALQDSPLYWSKCCNLAVLTAQVECNPKDNKDPIKFSWMLNTVKDVSALKNTWPASKSMHGKKNGKVEPAS